MISKVAWAGYFRRSWYWPHLLLCALFIFQVAKEGVTYESMMSSLGLCLSLVLMVMLFLGLNEGREELNRKTIIRLRTLPITWLEECFGSALALVVYGITLLAPLIVIFLGAYQVGLFEVNITKWEELEESIKVSGGRIVVEGPSSIKDTERLAIKTSLLEGRIHSMNSFAILKPEQTNLEEDLMIKARRLTYLPYQESNFEFQKNFMFKNSNLEMRIDQVFLLKEKQSFLLTMINGSMILVVHGVFLSVLFILLGRKVSIEVGVFFILGCLLIQAVYALLGEELLQDAVERLSNRDQTKSKFTTLWWEPYLFEWTKILAQLEGLKGLFKFDSTIDAWVEKKYISFPFLESKFIQETMTFMVMIAIGIGLLRPRET